jgi:hypothetical protein
MLGEWIAVFVVLLGIGLVAINIGGASIRTNNKLAAVWAIFAGVFFCNGICGWAKGSYH